MSYVNRGTRAFRTRDEAEAGAAAEALARPIRSEARLKSYVSASDLRAWSDIVEERRRHILELDVLNRQRGCLDNLLPLPLLFKFLMANKNARMGKLERKQARLEKLLRLYSRLKLAPEQRRRLDELKAQLDENYARRIEEELERSRPSTRKRRREPATGGVRTKKPKGVTPSGKKRRPAGRRSDASLRGEEEPRRLPKRKRKTRPKELGKRRPTDASSEGSERAEPFRRRDDEPTTSRKASPKAKAPKRRKEEDDTSPASKPSGPSPTKARRDEATKPRETEKKRRETTPEPKPKLQVVEPSEAPTKKAAAKEGTPAGKVQGEPLSQRIDPEEPTGETPGPPKLPTEPGETDQRAPAAKKKPTRTHVEPSEAPTKKAAAQERSPPGRYPGEPSPKRRDPKEPTGKTPGSPKLHSKPDETDQRALAAKKKPTRTAPKTPSEPDLHERKPRDEEPRTHRKSTSELPTWEPPSEPGGKPGESEKSPGPKPPGVSREPPGKPSKGAGRPQHEMKPEKTDAARAPGEEPGKKDGTPGSVVEEPGVTPGKPGVSKAKPREPTPGRGTAHKEPTPKASPGVAKTSPDDPGEKPGVRKPLKGTVPREPSPGERPGVRVKPSDSRKPTPHEPAREEPGLSKPTERPGREAEPPRRPRAPGEPTAGVGKTPAADVGETAKEPGATGGTRDPSGKREVPYSAGQRPEKKTGTPRAKIPDPVTKGPVEGNGGEGTERKRAAPSTRRVDEEDVPKKKKKVDDGKGTQEKIHKVPQEKKGIKEKEPSTDEEPLEEVPEKHPKGLKKKGLKPREEREEMKDRLKKKPASRHSEEEREVAIQLGIPTEETPDETPKKIHEKPPNDFRKKGAKPEEAIGEMKKPLSTKPPSQLSKDEKGMAHRLGNPVEETPKVTSAKVQDKLPEHQKKKGLKPQDATEETKDRLEKKPASQFPEEEKALAAPLGIPAAKPPEKTLGQSQEKPHKDQMKKGVKPQDVTEEMKDRMRKKPPSQYTEEDKAIASHSAMPTEEYPGETTKKIQDKLPKDLKKKALKPEEAVQEMKDRPREKPPSQYTEEEKAATSHLGVPKEESPVKIMKESQDKPSKDLKKKGLKPEEATEEMKDRPRKKPPSLYPEEKKTTASHLDMPTKESPEETMKKIQDTPPKDLKKKGLKPKEAIEEMKDRLQKKPPSQYTAEEKATASHLGMPTEESPEETMKKIQDKHPMDLKKRGLKPEEATEEMKDRLRKKPPSQYSEEGKATASQLDVPKEESPEETTKKIQDKLPKDLKKEPKPDEAIEEMKDHPRKKPPSQYTEEEKATASHLGMPTEESPKETMKKIQDKPPKDLKKKGLKPEEATEEMKDRLRKKPPSQYSEEGKATASQLDVPKGESPEETTKKIQDKLPKDLKKEPKPDEAIEEMKDHPRKKPPSQYTEEEKATASHLGMPTDESPKETMKKIQDKPPKDLKKKGLKPEEATEETKDRLRKKPPSQYSEEGKATASQLDVPKEESPEETMKKIQDKLPKDLKKEPKPDEVIEEMKDHLRKKPPSQYTEEEKAIDSQLGMPTEESPEETMKKIQDKLPKDLKKKSLEPEGAIEEAKDRLRKKRPSQYTEEEKGTASQLGMPTEESPEETMKKIQDKLPKDLKKKGLKPEEAIKEVKNRPREKPPSQYTEEEKATASHLGMPTEESPEETIKKIQDKRPKELKKERPKPKEAIEEMKGRLQKKPPSQYTEDEKATASQLGIPTEESPEETMKKVQDKLPKDLKKKGLKPEESVEERKDRLRKKPPSQYTEEEEAIASRLAIPTDESPEETFKKVQDQLPTDLKKKGPKPEEEMKDRLRKKPPSQYTEDEKAMASPLGFPTEETEEKIQDKIPEDLKKKGLKPEEVTEEMKDRLKKKPFSQLSAEEREIASQLGIPVAEAPEETLEEVHDKIPEDLKKKKKTPKELLETLKERLKKKRPSQLTEEEKALLSELEIKMEEKTPEDILAAIEDKIPEDLKKKGLSSQELLKAIRDRVKGKPPSELSLEERELAAELGIPIEETPDEILAGIEDKIPEDLKKKDLSSQEMLQTLKDRLREKPPSELSIEERQSTAELEIPTRETPDDVLARIEDKIPEDLRKKRLSSQELLKAITDRVKKKPPSELSLEERQLAAELGIPIEETAEEVSARIEDMIPDELKKKDLSSQETIKALKDRLKKKLPSELSLEERRLAAELGIPLRETPDEVLARIEDKIPEDLKDKGLSSEEILRTLKNRLKKERPSELSAEDRALASELGLDVDQTRAAEDEEEEKAPFVKWEDLEEPGLPSVEERTFPQETWRKFPEEERAEPEPARMFAPEELQVELPKITCRSRCTMATQTPSKTEVEPGGAPREAITLPPEEQLGLAAPGPSAPLEKESVRIFDLSRKKPEDYQRLLELGVVSPAEGAGGRDKGCQATCSDTMRPLEDEGSSVSITKDIVEPMEKTMVMETRRVPSVPESEGAPREIPDVAEEVIPAQAERPCRAVCATSDAPSRETPRPSKGPGVSVGSPSGGTESPAEDDDLDPGAADAVPEEPGGEHVCRAVRSSRPSQGFYRDVSPEQKVASIVETARGRMVARAVASGGVVALPNADAEEGASERAPPRRSSIPTLVLLWVDRDDGDDATDASDARDEHLRDALVAAQLVPVLRDSPRTLSGEILRRRASSTAGSGASREEFLRAVREREQSTDPGSVTETVEEAVAQTCSESEVTSKVFDSDGAAPRRDESDTYEDALEQVDGAEAEAFVDAVEAPGAAVPGEVSTGVATGDELGAPTWEVAVEPTDDRPETKAAGAVEEPGQEVTVEPLGDRLEMSAVQEPDHVVVEEPTEEVSTGDRPEPKAVGAVDEPEQEVTVEPLGDQSEMLAVLEPDQVVVEEPMEDVLTGDRPEPKAVGAVDEAVQEVTVVPLGDRSEPALTKSAVLEPDHVVVEEPDQQVPETRQVPARHPEPKPQEAVAPTPAAITAPTEFRAVDQTTETDRAPQTTQKWVQVTEVQRSQSYVPPMVAMVPPSYPAPRVVRQESSGVQTETDTEEERSKFRCAEEEKKEIEQIMARLKRSVEEAAEVSRVCKAKVCKGSEEPERERKVCEGLCSGDREASEVPKVFREPRVCRTSCARDPKLTQVPKVFREPKADLEDPEAVVGAGSDVLEAFTDPNVRGGPKSICSRRITRVFACAEEVCDEVCRCKETGVCACGSASRDAHGDASSSSTTTEATTPQRFSSLKVFAAARAVSFDRLRRREAGSQTRSSEASDEGCGCADCDRDRAPFRADPVSSPDIDMTAVFRAGAANDCSCAEQRKTAEQALEKLENIRQIAEERDELRRKLEESQHELEVLKRSVSVPKTVQASKGAAVGDAGFRTCEEEIDALEREIASLRSGDVTKDVEAVVIKKEVEVLKRYCSKLSVIQLENKKLKTLLDSHEEKLHLLGLAEEDDEALRALKRSLLEHGDVARERDELRRRVQTLESELYAYRDAPEDVEVYKQRSRLLDEVLRDRDRLGRRLEELRGVDEELAELRARSARARDLDEQLLQATREAARLESELESARCRCSYAEIEALNQRAECDALRSRLACAEHEAENARLRAEDVGRARAENEQLRRDLDAMTRAQREADELRTRLRHAEVLRAERDMYKSKYEHLVGLECECDILRAQVEIAKDVERERDSLANQVEDLEACVNDQEREIKRLVCHIDHLARGRDDQQEKLRNVLLTMRAEMERKDDLIRSSEQKLSCIQSELLNSIQGLSQETSNLKTTKDNLDKELRCARRANDVLRLQLDDVHRQNLELRQRLDELAAADRRKDAELEALRRDHRESPSATERTDVEQLGRQLESAREENRRLQSSIAEIGGAVQGDEHFQALLRQSKCAVQKVAEELARQYRDWDGIAKELRSSRLSKETADGSCQARPEDEETPATRGEWDRCRKQQCQKIALLEEKIRQLELELSMANEAILELRDRLANAERLAAENLALKRHSTEVQDVAKGEIQELLGHLKRAREQLAALEDENDKLKRELENLKAEKDQLIRIINEARGEGDYLELQREKGDLLAKIAALEQQLRKALQDQAELERLRAASGDFARLQLENEQLKRMLEEMPKGGDFDQDAFMKQLHQCMDDKHGLLTRIADLEKQLQKVLKEQEEAQRKLQGEFEKLQLENEQLKKMLEAMPKGDDFDQGAFMKQLHQCMDDKHGLLERIADLEKQLQKVLKEQEEAQRKLQAEFDKLQLENEQLKKMLEAMPKGDDFDQDAFMKQLHQCMDDKHGLLARIADIEKQLQKVLKEQEEAQRKVQADFDKLQLENEQLKKMLEGIPKGDDFDQDAFMKQLHQCMDDKHGLLERIADLEKQLQKVLKEQEEAQRKLQADFDKLQLENEQLKKMLEGIPKGDDFDQDAFMKQLHQCMDDKHGLLERIADLEKQLQKVLKEQEEAQRKLQADFDKLQLENEQLKKMLEGIPKGDDFDQDAFMKQLHQCMDDKHGLLERIADLEKQLQKVLKEQEEAQRKLQADFDKLQLENEQLKKMLEGIPKGGDFDQDAFMKQLHQCMDDKQGLLARIADLEKRSSQDQNELERLRAELEKQKMGPARRKRSLAESPADDLQAQIDALRRENAQLLKDLEELPKLRDTNKDLSDKYNRALAELEELRRQLAEQNGALERLRKENDDMSKLLESNLMVTSRRSSKLEDELKSLQLRNQQLQEELEKLRKLNGQLEQEKRDIADKLAAALNDKKLMVEREAKLLDELEKLRKAQPDLELLEALRRENEDLKKRTALQASQIDDLLKKLQTKPVKEKISEPKLDKDLKEKEALQAIIDDLERQLKNMSQKPPAIPPATSLERMLKELTKRLEDEQRRADAAEKAYRDLKARDATAMLNDDIARLQERIAQLEAENRKLHQDLAARDEQLARLAKDDEQLRKDLARAQQERDSYKSDLEKLKAGASADEILKNELEKLKRRLGELEKENASLRSDLGQCGDDKSKLEEKLNRLRDELNKSKVDLAKAQGDGSKTRKELENALNNAKRDADKIRQLEADKERLAKTIENLQGEIDRLKKELGAALDSAKSGTGATAELQKENADLKQKNQALSGENQKLSKELSNALAELENLRAQLAKLRDENAALRSADAALRKQLDGLQEENRALRGAAKEASADADRLRKALDEAESQLARLDAEKAKMAKDLAAALDEARQAEAYGDLKLRLAQLEAENARLRGDLAKANDEAKRRAELDRLRDDSKLRDRAARLEAENSRLNGELNGALDDLAKANALIAQLQAGEAKLKQRLAAAEAENAALRKELNGAFDEARRSAAEVSRLRDDESKLKRRLAALEGENSKLKSELDAALGKLRAADDALARLKGDESDLRKKMALLEAENAKAKRDLEATRRGLEPTSDEAILGQKVALLEEENAKLKRELEKLRAEHAACPKKAKELQDLLAELRRKLSGLEAENSDLKSKYAGAMGDADELAKLRDLEDKLRKQLAKLQTDNDRLGESVAALNAQLKRGAGDLDASREAEARLRTRNAGLEKENAKLKSDLDSTLGALKNAEKSLADLRDENARLRSRIAKLEGENAQLKKALDAASAELSSAKKKDDEIAALKSKLAALEAENKRLRSELDSARDQSSKDLSKLRDDDDKLKQRLAGLEAENARLRKDLERALAEAKQTSDNLGNVRGENGKLQQRIRQLEAEIAELKRQLDSALDDAKRGVTGVSKIQDDDARLKQRIAQLERDNARLKADLEAALKESRRGSDAADQLRAENGKQKGRIADLEEEIAALRRQLEKSLADSTKGATGLRDENSSLRQKLAQLQAENEKLRKSLEAALQDSKDKSRLAEENSRLQKKIEDLGKEIDRLKKELASSLDQQKRTEDLLRKQREGDEKLKQKLAELQKANSQLKSDLDASDNKLKSLTDENNGLKSETANLKQSLDRASKENSRLKSELERSSKENQTLRDDLAGLRQRLARLEAENARLKKALDSALGDSRSASGELEKLRRQNSKLQQERDALRLDGDKLRGQLEDASREIDRLKARLDEALKDNGDLRRDLEGISADLRKRLDAATGENGALKRKIDELENQLRRLRGAGDELDRLKAAEAKDKDRLRDLAAELERQKRECQDTIASLKEQFERDLRALLQKNEASIASLQAAHEAQLRELLEKYDEEIARLKGIIEAQRRKSLDIKDKVEQVESIIDGERRKGKEERRRSRMFEKKLEDSVAERERLLRELEEERGRRRALEDELERLRAQAGPEDERARREALEDELARLKAQLRQRAAKPEERLTVATFETVRLPAVIPITAPLTESELRLLEHEPCGPRRDDFEDILDKVSRGGVECLRLDELQSLHAKICRCTADVVEQIGQGTPRGAEAGKLGLLKRIASLEGDLMRKQKHAQQKVLAMQYAVKMEKERLGDLRKSLEDERRRGSDVGLGDEAAPRGQRTYPDKKLDRYMSAMEEEKAKTRTLENELEKERTHNDHLKNLLEAERERTRQSKRRDNETLETMKGELEKIMTRRVKSKVQEPPTRSTSPEKDSALVQKAISDLPLAARKIKSKSTGRLDPPDRR